MRIINYIIITIFFISIGCKSEVKKEKVYTDEVVWRMGWTIFEKLISEDTIGARMVFDSLIESKKELSIQFLVEGMSTLSAKDTNYLRQIICEQSDSIQFEFCQYLPIEFEVKCCKSAIQRNVLNKVSHPNLRIELSQMMVLDQAYRNNRLEDQAKLLGMIIPLNFDGINIDAQNQRRLKGIIAEVGFPTKAMVGSEALHDVFLLIQHSDSDVNFSPTCLI